MLRVGSVLQSRYLVEECIATGGTSEVYRAQDQRLGTDVAVKKFVFSSEANPTSRDHAMQAFQQEATLQASLSHPRLPRVIDFFSENETPFLVMDLVRGETLYQRILEAPPIFDGTRLHRWTEQMLDVLEYLHQSSGRVIVRDFKPSNIIVSDSGDIKIVDLGLALSLASKGATHSGGLCTPGFAAPELYGISESDPRTDIYSLGATLYFCWTQQVPPDALSRGFKQVPTIPPSAYNPTIPSSTEQAILRAMELDPDRRFPEVSQMRSAMVPEGSGPKAGGAREEEVPLAVLPTVQAPVVSFALIDLAVPIAPKASLELPVSPVPHLTIPMPPFLQPTNFASSWQAAKQSAFWRTLRFRVICYVLAFALLLPLGLRYTTTSSQDLEDRLLQDPKIVAAELDARKKKDESERARLAQERQEQERQALVAYAQYQTYAKRALDDLDNIDGALEVGCNYSRFKDMVSCLNTDVRRLTSTYEGRAESRYRSYRGICEALDSYSLALSYWRLKIETDDDELDRQARENMQKCWHTAQELIKGVKLALNTGQES